MAASALLPGSATAQRAGGEIAVSLTILPPSVGQSVALAVSRIDHDETASNPTASATTTRGAQVVTTRPSSNLRRSVAASRELVLSCTASRAGCAARGIEHGVDVRSLSPDDTVRVVRLRVEYAVVPGT